MPDASFACWHQDMSEADQRLVAQDIVERMKRRAPECKKGDDYNHSNKAFRRMFERVGVL